MLLLPVFSSNKAYVLLALFFLIIQVVTAGDADNRRYLRQEKETDTTNVPDGYVLMQARDHNLTYPQYRFKQWTNLINATQSVAEFGLGYNETTWNNLYTNPIEEFDYSSLSQAEKHAAWNIGFEWHAIYDVATSQWMNYSIEWDCYINHFVSSVVNPLMIEKSRRITSKSLFLKYEFNNCFDRKIMVGK